MKKLIIFDLDGTLLNTVADLAQSTNYALKKNGFPEHEISEYKYFVGNGINKLFERALPKGDKTEENILAVRKEFLAHYDKHNADLSNPYPGIKELLETLQNKKIALAVASNKYHSATEKLIKHYFPQIHFIAVLGQREGIAPKPDPAIISEILSIYKVEKEEILYVGDSGVDMQTAFNSGITSLGVTWGFRTREELKENKANFLIDTPEEILSFL